MLHRFRGRMPLGRVTQLGGVVDQRAYPTVQIRVEGVQEEKLGLAMRLNPLVPKDHKTFALKLVLPDTAYQLVNVDKAFVERTRSAAG